MGGGSSLFGGKKVRAERKAREEAEQKAKEHEEAVKALQMELEQTREQLKAVQEELQGREIKGGAFPGGNQPNRWSPCRVNNPHPGKRARAIVLHDGENCPVINHPDIQFAHVQDAVVALIRPYLSDPNSSSTEGEGRTEPAPSPEKGVQQMGLRDRGLLASLDIHFFLPRDPSNPYHPHSNYWNDMDSLGVHLESVGDKKGAVDTKMKLVMNRLAKDETRAARDKIVLLIAGDRDYAEELGALQAAGFYVLLLHRGNVSASRIVESCCDLAFDCWDKILCASLPSLPPSLKSPWVPLPPQKHQAVLREAKALNRGKVLLWRWGAGDTLLTLFGHTPKSGAQPDEAVRLLRSLVDRIVVQVRCAQCLATPCVEITVSVFFFSTGGAVHVAKALARSLSLSLSLQAPSR